MIRFIHSADWQIGKPFARVEDAEKRTLLRSERIEVIRRIAAAAREQDAEFFETFADRGDGLRQVQVALGGAPAGLRMGCRVQAVDAATRKHVGAGRETGVHRAAGHQDLDALRRVAQQQHGGGGANGRGFALGVQELGRSDHARHYPQRGAGGVRVPAFFVGEVQQIIPP